MKKIFYFLLASLFLLTGCSTKYYSAPPQTQNTATIQSFETKKPKQSIESRLMMIDGKYVTAYNYENAFGWSIKDVKVPVLQGPHAFDILTTVNSNLFTNYLQAYLRVPATIEAGKRYQIQASLSENIVKVWIVDSEGNIISPVVSGSLEEKK